MTARRRPTTELIELMRGSASTYDAEVNFGTDCPPLQLLLLSASGSGEVYSRRLKAAAGRLLFRWHKTAANHMRRLNIIVPDNSRSTHTS